MSDQHLTKEQAEAARRSAAKATSFVSNLEKFKNPASWGEPHIRVVRGITTGYVVAFEGVASPVVYSDANITFAKVLEEYPTFGDLLRDSWHPQIMKKINLKLDKIWDTSISQAQKLEAADFYEQVRRYRDTSGSNAWTSGTIYPRIS